LKLLQENVGKTLENTGIGDNFLNRRTPITQQIRARINCIKLRNFYTARETVAITKRQPIE
jgi:hypothetical protein